MNDILKIASPPKTTAVKPVVKPGAKPIVPPANKPRKGAPATSPVGKNRPNASTTTGLNTGGGSIPEVKEMQNAMQNLAHTVVYETSQQHTFRKPGDAKRELADEKTLEGKDSFNDFIAENFIGELPEGIKGVEWNTNPDVKYRVEKSKQTLQNRPTNKLRGQTDIYEMDVVLDTMRRIGTANSELNSDGNWSWRTNNALKNMFAYSYALLQLEGELGLSNDIYTINDLRTFQQNLPTDDQVQGSKINLTNIEKKNRAIVITKLLEKIKRLYRQFRTNVLSDPDKRGFIENTRAFAQFTQQGSNPDSLSSTENNLLEKNMELKLPIKYIARAKVQNKDMWDNVKNPTLDAWGQIDYIPIKALTSKEEYLKWMMGPTVGIPSENMAISIFDKTIKPQIDKLIKGGK